MLRKILVIHCQCSGKELKGLAVCEWRVISTLVRQLLPARPSGFFSSEANLCNVTSKKPQLSKICREAIFTKCCNRFKSSRPRKLTILVENDFSNLFLITQLVMMSRIHHQIINLPYQIKKNFYIIPLFILYRDF